MPRLKGPPRPLPEEEDIGPVTVDVGETGAAPAEPKAEAAPASEPVVVQPEPEREDENSLLRQLEELKKSESSYRQQLESERTARVQAQQQAQKQQQDAQKYRGDAEQGQYDAVLNALGAVQAEADGAQRDYESALARGDFATAGQAQRRMARAESRIDRLEEGKNLIEQQRERRTQEPDQPIQVQPADQVEAFINNLQGLSNQERGWLKSHRDVITDQAKYARIQAAYYDAVDQGLQRDSPEYFEFLETRLGYSKKKEQPTEEAEWDEPQPRRSPVVSAPPSRDAPSLSSGRSTSSKVTLTAAEREAAKFSLPHLSQGEAEREYAKQKLKIQRGRAAGEIE